MQCSISVLLPGHGVFEDLHGVIEFCLLETSLPAKGFLFRGFLIGSRFIELSACSTQHAMTRAGN
ncbi:unnamed protein product [Ilex paraguariensis]|uniref:Uncharacterized protein n=1 Tax=Ilex paraguariensis TaxID=185542 RepID=A0ABC8TSB9_9AQUA